MHGWLQLGRVPQKATAALGSISADQRRAGRASALQLGRVPQDATAALDHNANQFARAPVTTKETHSNYGMNDNASSAQRTSR